MTSPAPTGPMRARLVESLQRSAASNVRPGPEAARSQDFLYDDTGRHRDAGVKRAGQRKTMLEETHRQVQDAVMLDTSALMAMLLGEPAGMACAAVLGSEVRLQVSAGTLAEALIAACSRGIGPEWLRWWPRAAWRSCQASLSRPHAWLRLTLLGGRVIILLGSTSVTASPTCWRARQAHRSSRSGRTLCGRM